MNKKVNPRRRPVTITEYELNRIKKAASDEAINLSIALFLTVMLDKFGFDAEGLQKVWADIVEAIRNAPVVDAVPVVHGQWITSGKEVCGDRQYFCSACNQEYWETQSWPKRANYCPNCGADMREENRE